MANVEHNADEVADWLESQRRDFVGAVEQMLDRATQETLSTAKKKVPVDTGALKDSLQKDGHTVGSPLEYAPHQGLGTIYQEGTDYLWGPASDILDEEIDRLAKA